MPKVVMMFNLQWYNTYPALIVPFTVSVFWDISLAAILHADPARAV